MDRPRTGMSAKQKRQAKKDTERSKQLQLSITHGMFQPERVSRKQAVKDCKCNECKQFRKENPGHHELGG